MEFPQNAVEIIRILQKQGFIAFFAGGCVRDMIFNRDPSDYDIATNASTEQVKALFKKTVPVGESFGVVRVVLDKEEYEVASFRTDGKYSDGRRPDAITLSTPEEDSRRRDFTINGLFYDPTTGQVIDYVNGTTDIINRIIRAVGDASKRFEEDRLRMLRAVRFSAQLPDFRIHETTREAIKKESAHISLISKERITQELAKIWSSPAPAKGWLALLTTGLLPHVCPNVEPIDELIQMFERIPEETTDRAEREILGWALIAQGLSSVSAVEDHMKTHFRLSKRDLKRLLGLIEVKQLLTVSSIEPTADVVGLLLSSEAETAQRFQRVLLGQGPRSEMLNRIAQDLIANPLPLGEIPNGDDLKHLGLGKALGEALKIASASIYERRAKTKAEAIAVVKAQLQASDG